jgi:hypothetical protein
VRSTDYGRDPFGPKNLGSDVQEHTKWPERARPKGRSAYTQALRDKTGMIQVVLCDTLEYGGSSFVGIGRRQDAEQVSGP